MRKLRLVVGAVGLATLSVAAFYPILINWQILSSKASVKFSMLAHGQTLVGSFQQLGGTIQFDPQKPEEARFDCQIPISTIETGNEKRNGHLQAERWFDAAKYPTIGVKSVAVTGNEKDGFRMRAKVEIKGESREVDFPFQFIRESDETGMFKGSFQVKRTDFAVGKADQEVGDDVIIQLEVPVGLPKE